MYRTSVEPRRFLFVFFAVSALLTVSVFLVPFLSPYGSLVYLDGTPGVIDHWDIWSSEDPFTMVLYLLGDIFCHQQMSRSVILNGSEMPICIRDLGLLMGFMFGCLITSLKFGHPAIYRHARAYVVISFLLIFADWSIQHAFDLNVPFTRLVTGLLAGAGFSLILYCWTNSVFFSEKTED